MVMECNSTKLIHFQYREKSWSFMVYMSNKVEASDAGTARCKAILVFTRATSKHVQGVVCFSHAVPNCLHCLHDVEFGYSLPMALSWPNRLTEPQDTP